MANLAARVGAVASLAVATFLVARLGGPAAVGVYALLRLLPALMGSLLSGGLPSATPYFLAGPTRSDPRLRSTLVAIAAVSGLAGLALWVVGAPVLARVFFANLPVKLVALAGFRAITYALCIASPKACSQGTNDLAGSNRVILFEDLMFVPAYASLWLAGLHGTEALIVSLLSADLAVGAIGWIRLVRKGFFSGMSRPSVDLSRQVYAFGLRGQVGNLILLLNLRLDFALLGALAGASTLGTYAVASKFAELLRLPMLAITFVLLPRFASEGRTRAASNARAIIAKAGLVTAVMAIPLALVAVLIPLIFGEAFRVAIVPAQILLAGLASGGVVGVITAFLYGIGRPGLNSLGMGAGLAVTVVLDLLLIPRFGAVGAAIASSAAYLTTAGILGAWYWALTHPSVSSSSESDALAALRPAHQGGTKAEI